MIDLGTIHLLLLSPSRTEVGTSSSTWYFALAEEDERLGKAPSVLPLSKGDKQRFLNYRCDLTEGDGRFSKGP